MAFFNYSDSSGARRRIDLGQRLNIGRHPSQDLQLLDRIVSKEHAVVELTNNGYTVYDCGSRNGTYVNGRQLVEPYLLKDGDEITIGSTALSYVAKDPQDSAVDRVTFHEAIDSAIRTRISTRLDVGFLPESHISDVESLRADYEKLRIANELSQALSLEFDLDRLLHKILDRAFAIFRCDRGVILIQDKASGAFLPSAARLRAGRNVKPGAQADNIRLSETILREVIDKHEGILSSDAMMDRRFSGSHSIVLEGIRSAMSVPLLYEDRLLGIIHLDSQLAVNAFSEKDLHLLSGFARQAAIAIEHSQLVERMNREAINRQNLSRLLPPLLVEQVLQGQMELRKGGDIRFGTVLFADIRGFTTMAESYPPQEIVTMLNEYFEIMVEIIFNRGGTLDKFIGDAIMAIWGAPFSTPDDAIQAVRTAVEMQQALVEFNETRRQEGQDAIHCGIGLNTGELVAGYMGSTRSMSYTVVGDVVNTGSRICALAGPGDVVISAATLAQLGDAVQVEPLPPAKLKGKRDAVEVYKMVSMSGLWIPQMAARYAQQP